MQYDFFTEAEVSQVVSCFKPRQVKRKALLVQKGEVSRHVFFISKGCIRLYLVDYRMKEHTILFGTEGYWMGDLQAFINDTVASYNYQALEDTEVMAIHRSSWDKLMSEVPGFVHYVSVLFRNALIVQQQRIVEYFTLSAEQRYDNLIRNRKELINRVPQKYLASYIGITPEFLSQIRSKSTHN